MRIKKCPFCGAEARAIENTDSDYSRNFYWFVMCNGPKNHMLDMCADTREDAILTWNERSLKDKLDEVLNEG